MKYGSFLIALLLLTAAPVSADTIYRWTDDKGVTQYTAHPPRDREFTQVNTRSGRSVSAGATCQSASPPPTPEPAEAQAQAGYPSKEEPCQVAPPNLSPVGKGGRTRGDGGPGGARLMGEDEALERLDETRACIADHCCRLAQHAKA